MCLFSTCCTGIPATKGRWRYTHHDLYHLRRGWKSQNSQLVSYTKLVHYYKYPDLHTSYIRSLLLLVWLDVLPQHFHVGTHAIRLCVRLVCCLDLRELLTFIRLSMSNTLSSWPCLITSSMLTYKSRRLPWLCQQYAVVFLGQLSPSSLRKCTML